MHDYLFIDNESGEQFFVECETYEEAEEILNRVGFSGMDIEYIDEYSVEEAEILGYDTY